jgi:hypothetical protein
MTALDTTKTMLVTLELYPEELEIAIATDGSSLHHLLMLALLARMSTDDPEECLPAA